ncbi:N-acetyltransferase [Pseudomonas aeruginosa]|nr:N-acetyltransferase [Pseudomonas aeruginosa]
MSASIRDAGVADLPGILAIYNDAVGNTTAIWNETPVDLANRQAWFDTRARPGPPILVASDAAGEVLGYASYGDWRPFEGFRGTVEHSVYVRDDQRGKGLGVQLLQALIERARAQGLHRRLGFEISGQMPQVGQKFGRWLDLTFMQLNLDPTRSAP